jgi:hypothetical protein
MTSAHACVPGRRAAGVVISGASRMFYNLRDAVKAFEKRGKTA